VRVLNFEQPLYLRRVSVIVMELSVELASLWWNYLGPLIPEAAAATTHPWIVHVSSVTWVLGFRVEGVGFSCYGLWFMVHGLGCMV
jgi:hypothetical protein